MKKSYTTQFLAFTLTDLTTDAKSEEFALHLGQMSQQGWNFVELHPVGTGILVVYSSDVPATS